MSTKLFKQGILGLFTIAILVMGLPIAFAATAPTFSNLTISHNPYDPTTQSNAALSYTLNNANGDDILAKIYTTTTPKAEVRTWTVTKQKSGIYSWTWNGKDSQGKFLGDGSYSLEMFSANGNIKPLSMNFTIASILIPFSLPPIVLLPTVSNLSVSPNPYYSTKGNATFSYNLNNSSGAANVLADIFNIANPNSVLHSWNLSNQNSGKNTLIWDGKDTQGKVAAKGSYSLKVYGLDGSNQIKSVQQNFTIGAVTIPSSNNCDGFSDVSKNDSDCAAFTYMKSIGAMTGNPNGTLTPENFLQRDQMAKIVLITFKKFNSSVDYCHGLNPFPDVTNTAWSFQYICRGVELSVITGYQAGVDAGFYRPGRSVNRVEFLALTLRNLNENMPSNNSYSYHDVPTGVWYNGYAKYSKNNSLYIGTNLYPTAYTTRREVAEIIYKLHNLGKL